MTVRLLAVGEARGQSSKYFDGINSNRSLNSEHRDERAYDLCTVQLMSKWNYANALNSDLL